MLSRHRHEVYGVVSILALGLVAVVVVASYLHVFTPSVSVTLRADRAGLLLLPEADVAMHDVRVGRISAVRSDGADGALIDLEIDADKADLIPADVTARLDAPTVFGPKYVDLVPPPTPSTRTIADGDVIERADVQVEVNTVFDNLMTVLQTVEPVKINAGLGALSTALNGRGDTLGQSLVDLNAYLERLNPSIPTLQRDLESLAPVVDTYADAAPDILALLGNATTTSTTLVERESDVDAVTTSLGGFSDDIATVFRENSDELGHTLDVLNPTTALLRRYAPVMPCTFASLNYLRKVLLPTFGGSQPGLRSLTTFEPGEEGYKPDENLPKLGVDAPGCYGGIPEPGEIPAHVSFDDGSPRLDTRNQPVGPGDKPFALIVGGNEMGPTIMERFRQGPGAAQETAEANPEAGADLAGAMTRGGPDAVEDHAEDGSELVGGQGGDR
jgi:phospholipid/cholesterol/gamma-HCH transport system substrate-binding protein